jgi:hypothetical protein
VNDCLAWAQGSTLSLEQISCCAGTNRIGLMDRFRAFARAPCGLVGPTSDSDISIFSYTLSIFIVLFNILINTWLVSHV